MKRVRRYRTHRPVLRALIIMSVAAVVTTGVTFAVLQSQTAALNDNTIESATAEVQPGLILTVSYPADRLCQCRSAAIPCGSKTLAQHHYSHG